MARIVIFSENYGGPGTGQFAHQLSVALAVRGHSVQGKTSLNMSMSDISSLQADLVIGQHRAAGIGRTVSETTKIPFVIIMQGEKYTPAMAADLVVFASNNYIEGYKKLLGNTPAVSIENGIAELCDRISLLANESAANKLKEAGEPAPAGGIVGSDAIVTVWQSIAQIESRAAAEVVVDAAAKPTAITTIDTNAPYNLLVSVIVTAQDDGVFVEHTIKNVLDQNYKNVEVVFVDDGSSDVTAKTVSLISDPRLVAFFRPSRSGRHITRNFGFAQSKGKFVMFIDAGDAITTDAIGALVARIRADSSPGATVGRPTNVIEQHRRWAFASGGISDHDALHVADSITLYRRAAVEMAGGFCHAESVREMDADFIKRIVKVSSIMFVNTPVGSRHHAETGK